MGGVVSAKIKKEQILMQSVYRALRADLVLRTLVPGAQLKIGALAARFDVSMAVQREALARLSSEELVEAEPQRGFRVAPVSAEQLQDLTAVRIEVETMCLRQSVARFDLLAETRLEDAMKALLATAEFDTAGRHLLTVAWSRAHSAFHKALVSRCGSPVLLRIRRQLFDRAERYRALSLSLGKQLHDIERDHRTMVDAVRRRDVEEAVPLLAEHIRETSRILLSAKSDGKSVLPSRQAA